MKTNPGIDSSTNTDISKSILIRFYYRTRKRERIKGFNPETKIADICLDFELMYIDYHTTNNRSVSCNVSNVGSLRIVIRASLRTAAGAAVPELVEGLKRPKPDPYPVVLRIRI